MRLLRGGAPMAMLKRLALAVDAILAFVIGGGTHIKW